MICLCPIALLLIYVSRVESSKSIENKDKIRQIISQFVANLAKSNITGLASWKTIRLENSSLKSGGKFKCTVVIEHAILDDDGNVAGTYQENPISIHLKIAGLIVNDDKIERFTIRDFKVRQVKRKSLVKLDLRQWNFGESLQERIEHGDESYA